MPRGGRRPGSEKERIDKLMGDFNYKESNTWYLIKSLFGRELNQNELFHLSMIFEEITGCRIGRDQKRNKGLLVKLFDDNFNTFEPFIYRVGCVDSAGNYLGPMGSVMAQLYNEEEGREEEEEEEPISTPDVTHHEDSSDDDFNFSGGFGPQFDDVLGDGAPMDFDY